MSIGTQIDRYLARLIFVPLVGTLCLAAMLLLMDRMLKLFDFVVSEGGPVSIVFRMLANLIPEYMGLAIPVGLTLGILLAFRKLALSSELDSLRAVGLSYGRLLRVPFLYAFALLGLNFFIVGYVQPQAQYEYQSLRHELRSGALGASIKVGEFTDLGRRMTLRVERSENGGTDLHGVFLHLDQSDRAGRRDGRTLTASAARGTFLATDDPDTILLRLTNGRLVHNAPNYRVPRVLSFVQHDLPIDLPTIEAFRGRGDGTKEMTVAELLRTGQDARTPVNRRNAALANFYFRMVEVLMMLLVPLLAVALAVPPKRSTSGLGIFLAIAFVVTYHKVNQYAEQMGALGKIDPLIAVGTPFLIFSGLMVWMYWTLAHKPGGQPIGALERLFARISKRVRALFRRRSAGPGADPAADPAAA
ncbi:MAG: lipopolysaccharide export system permease protein [Sphingomonadales bacterium]|nr:lipopolysaccharide export system permease protein [Sphingomonadales bacterium]